jgi:hypothetical protein
MSFWSDRYRTKTEINLLLICSIKQFVFAAVVLKFFQISTFLCYTNYLYCVSVLNYDDDTWMYTSYTASDSNPILFTIS